MDKRTIYNIVKVVKAIDFFDQLYNGINTLDDELFVLVYEYYAENSDSSKTIKNIQLKGFANRSNNLFNAAKNVREIGDVHYNLLIESGIDFTKGDTFGQISKKLKRYDFKIKKLKKTNETESEDKDEVFIFEEIIIRLSMIFKFDINTDISIVQFMIYNKLAKENTDGK